MRKLDQENIPERNSNISKIKEEVKIIIKNFGKLVAKTRKNKNIKLQDLSKKSGVSVGVISDLENGKEKIPNLYTLIALAQTLEMNNDEFLRIIFGEIVHPDPTKKNERELLIDALIAYGVPEDVIENILMGLDLFYGKEPHLKGIYTNKRAKLFQKEVPFLKTADEQ